MKTITIVFSDEQFEVPRLNFGQLEEIMPLVPALSDRGTSLKAMLDIMQVVVGEKYPDVKVRALPVDFRGMKQAFGDVMAFSGLEMRSGEPGEAPAGENSTSETSGAA